MEKLKEELSPGFGLLVVVCFLGWMVPALIAPEFLGLVILPLAVLVFCSFFFYQSKTEERLVDLLTALPLISFLIIAARWLIT